MVMSRHIDPSPVHCEDCGWEGKVMDCKHGYQGFPIRGEDVEPIDYCPRCGSKNLLDLEDRGAKLLVPA